MVVNPRRMRTLGLIASLVPLYIYIYIKYIYIYTLAREVHNIQFFLQELASQLKSDLERPACMTANMFVNPDNQCPKKPRGRKKKENNNNNNNNNNNPKHSDAIVEQPSKSKRRRNAETQPRPSAAACGFSTEGMTNAEIFQRLEGAVDSEGGAEPAEVKVPRRRKAKAETNQASMAPEVDPNTAEVKVTRRRKAKKGEDVMGSEVDTHDAEVKMSRRKKAKQGEAKCEEGMVFEDVEVKASRKKGRGKVKNVTNTEPGDNGRPGCSSDGVSKTNAKRVTNTLEPEQLEPNKRRRTKASVSKASDQQTADNTDKEQAEASRKAEAKAKASRKSSAYHKAASAAKKRGASKEEQAAAGKAVPRTMTMCVCFDICISF